MNSTNNNAVYIESIDQFLNTVPERFLQTLKNKILQNKGDEALNLICQYVVKFFSYIPYNQCYHHGHFVYALLRKAMEV